MNQKSQDKNHSNTNFNSIILPTDQLIIILFKLQSLNKDLSIDNIENKFYKLDYVNASDKNTLMKSLLINQDRKLIDEL